MRIGRFLHDLNHLPEALTAFRSVLASPRSEPLAREIATRRIAEIERRLLSRQPPRRAVANADLQNVPGEQVVRTARKQWWCEGKGRPAVHAETCPQVIAPGERYV